MKVEGGIVGRRCFKKRESKGCGRVDGTRINKKIRIYEKDIRKAGDK